MEESNNITGKFNWILKFYYLNNKIIINPEELIILNKYYIPSCLVLIGDKLIDEDLEIKEHNALLVKIAFKWGFSLNSGPSFFDCINFKWFWFNLK